MKRLICCAAVLFMIVAVATAAVAQTDVLGLYFSDTEFTADTAHAQNSPGFMLACYIVLTNPTGTTVHGYEVGITSTAADFTVLYLPIFDTNEGTDTNQIVTFGTPMPVQAGGTVLSPIFIGTDSTEIETIAFGAADPSRVTGDVPGVDYGSGPLVACNLPFGVPEVAWLNGAVVPAERTAWGSIKSLFR
ncbi:MAG: hypothetical protein R6X35_10840 [Candidatus Krumholzibacteriia bacterium]